MTTAETNGKKKSKPPLPMPATPVVAQARRFVFRRGSHVELGQALLQELEIAVDGKLRTPVYDEGGLYTYDEKTGVWKQINEVAAGKIVQRFDGRRPTSGQVIKLKDADVRGAIACARREAAVEDFFVSAPAGLMFKDGLARLVNGKVERAPVSPDHRARFSYDFDYTEERPKRFLAALEGMFKPDADRDEKVKVVCEFAGVALLGQATRLQRWMLLKGAGDDGKSTLIEMLTAAMPEGSTCSIKPKDLENEYHRADLPGKLLNTVTEIEQRDMLPGETLKAVTTGDPMRGRHIRSSPIDFRPRAGHLFAANGYPRFSDSSHGFWRRPIVVTFNRRFTNDPERKVGLAQEIVQAERAQIVCWLVRAGAEALRRGAYIEPASHAEALVEWRGETDAVYEFAAECLVLATKRPISTLNGWSRPIDLYRAFRDWAYKTGHKEMSSTAFGRRMTELGHAEVKSNGVRWRPARLLRKNEEEKSDGSTAPN